MRMESGVCAVSNETTASMEIMGPPFQSLHCAPRRMLQGDLKATQYESRRAVAHRLSWRSETGYAVISQVCETSAAQFAESIVERECWWWDSNPQELSPSDLRNHRVYQFRHTSTSSAANPGNPEGQDARPRTRCRPRAKYLSGWLERRTKLLRSGLFSVG